jgi:indolepyruvate ferredoxin oxidoreductase, beta subunit
VNDAFKQQIVISGLGGQGVLFVTRLLAEAAMMNGYSVMTSETHGMAQRGGTVVSHLKVGNFQSPMIRPGRASGLIALKDETLDPFITFLQPEGWAVVNCIKEPKIPQTNLRCLDADGAAFTVGSPQSANLVMLGLAIHLMEGIKGLPAFCAFDDIGHILSERLKEKREMLTQALAAFEAGYNTG